MSTHTHADAAMVRRIREHLRRAQAVYREPDEPTASDVRRAIERDRRLIDRRNRENTTMTPFRIGDPPTVDEQVQIANAQKMTWAQVHHALRDTLPKLGDVEARHVWADLMLVALERDPTADDARRADVTKFAEAAKSGLFGPDTYRIG